MGARTGEVLPAAAPPVGGDGAKSAGKPASEVLTSRDGKIVGISRGDMRRLFMEW